MYECPGGRVAAPGTSFPYALLICSVVVALLLAAHELRTARLRWHAGLEVAA